MHHYDSAGPKHFSGWKPIKSSTYKLLLQKHKQKPFLTPQQVAEYEAIAGPEKQKKERGVKKEKESEQKVKLPEQTIAELAKLGIRW